LRHNLLIDDGRFEKIVIYEVYSVS